jgi:hypothetical protein
MAKLEDNQDHLIPSGDLKFQPPFAETCRAMAMKGTTQFALCLVGPPNDCKYLYHYAYIGICNHARCQDIVARTLQMDKNKTD